MAGRFDDSDYDLVIQGLNDGDPGADERLAQFTPEEKAGLKARVAARKALDLGGPGAQAVGRLAELKRQQESQPNYFNTTDGGVIKDDLSPGEEYQGIPGAVKHVVTHPLETLGTAGREAFNMGAGLAYAPAQVMGFPISPPQVPLESSPGAPLNPFALATQAAQSTPEPTSDPTGALKGLVMAPFQSAANVLTQPSTMIQHHPLETALTLGAGVGEGGRVATGIKEMRAATPEVAPPVTPPVAPPVEGAPIPLRPAPATFHGVQETSIPGRPPRPPINLYNLTEDVPEHNLAKGSTVSEQTLRKAGFEPPLGAPPPPSNPTPPQFASHLISQLDSPNPPPLSPRAVAKVGVDVAEPASRFANTLMKLNEPLQRIMGANAQIAGADPIKSSAYIDHLFNGLATMIEKQAYSRPKTWREAMFVTPTMDSAATRHIAANRSAYVMALQSWELGGPTEIFKKGTTLLNRDGVVKWRTQNALKLLWDDRAQAIQARNADLLMERQHLENELESLATSAEPDVAARRTEIHQQLAELPDPSDDRPSRYPMMAPSERAALMKDPAMQDFVKWFQGEWTPMVESMSNEAGIGARLRGPLGGYVSFADAWVEPKEVGPSSRGAWGQGSRSPYDVRPRRPKSARTATGAAPEELALSDDLFRYFYNTLADRMVASTKRDLMAELRGAALQTASTIGPMGEIPLRETTIQTSSGPRKVPVRGVTLEKLGGRTEDIYYVPEPYAQLFDYATKAPTKSELEAMSSLNSALTAQIVVLPAEAVRHGWNVVSAVTSTEFFRQYGHTARAMEALAGMHSKMAVAFYKAFNLSGPEFAQRLQRMANSNELRLANWEHTPEKGGVLQVASKGKYNPFRLLKDSVFGYPGAAKGVRGMETRLRAVIDMAMEEADPTMSDPAKARRINDNLGTYVKEVVPPLAEGLQKVYPFARARTALVKQGLRTMGSRDIFGRLNPYIGLAAASTVAQCLIANKLLDDQHRWPFEVPGWNPGSLILFEWNGRKVSIGADLIMNPLYRAGKATGITRAVEQALAGQKDPGSYVSEFGRNELNFLTSWAGPLATTAIVAGSGSVPYVTADHKLLSIEETSMAGSEAGKGHTRLKTVIKQAIPAMAKGREWADASGYQPRPTDEPWKSLYAVSDLFGVAPNISSVNPESGAQVSTYYRSADEAKQIAFEALQAARNVSPDQSVQLAFIRDYVNRHTNPSMIVLDGDKPKPANIFSYEIAISAFKNQLPRRAKGKAMSQLQPTR